MKSQTIWLVGNVAVLMALVACNPRDVPQAEAEAAAEQPAATAPAVPTPARQVAQERAPEPEPIVCATCGTIRSITAVTQQGQGTGVGAVVGAIVGGVAGNQVGGGSGRKIATAAGAIGGAVLGNKIEKDRKTDAYYEVVIDMEGGGQQFVTVPDATGIAVGSKVTVQGGNIALR